MVTSILKETGVGASERTKITSTASQVFDKKWLRRNNLFGVASKVLLDHAVQHNEVLLDKPLAHGKWGQVLNFNFCVVGSGQS